MNMEEIKKIIQESLENMSCSDIAFSETRDDFLVVVFNCKEITSFVTEIPGWSRSGIQLNISPGHQYRIEFKKLPGI